MGLRQNLRNLVRDFFMRVRDSDGYLPYDISDIYDAKPMFNDYTTDSRLFAAVMRNPALLKVIALQCDLFSLAKIYVYDKSGKAVDKDPALDKLANPNKFQSQQQFLWDYMFWNMMGTDYMYFDSKAIDSQGTNLYFLDPTKMTFPTGLNDYKDKIVLSNKIYDNILKEVVEYRTEDGKVMRIPLSNILTITDLSNGLGNWWKGNSRLAALYKVISNSEAALDAKNINVRYAGKFMVAGQSDPKNVNQLPMSEDEKQDIESKMNGRKSVHAVKSIIEIKRFVENMANLELGKAYLEDYFLIGSMYGIPRDVLEAYNSSTYENQEKARGAHVSYCLQPKGDQFMNALSTIFGYNVQGKTLVVGWDHLPFMQVFEKERADVQNKKILTLTNMLKINIPLEECNAFLDTNFKTAEYVATNQTTTNQGGNTQTTGN
jgi:hypothetical protein